MGSAASNAAAFPDDTSIVVVGGGYGGITLADHLLGTGKVKLISDGECFFHNVGALRACVEPEFANQIFIPFKETFGDSFVRGRVVGVDEAAKCVTLESGDQINYSHLVLATGSGGPFPAKMLPNHPNISKEDGIELLRNISKEIKEAETIVLIGGGAVGTELSGEIKTDYPDKNVILIHPNKTLCSSRFNPSTQSNLHALMARKDIQLMLEERVANLSDLQFNKCIKDQVVRTESGKEIKADLVIRCTGLKPLTDAFKDVLGDSINARGQIKVDEFFKVEGKDNIFAIGDITDIEEEKMSVAAVAHASVVSHNIKASFSGDTIKPYKPGKFLMVVPVGRNGGVSQVFGMTMGDFFTRNLKSKNLFAPKTWSMMKQKPPSSK